jgi:hypothetical protein
MRRVSEIYGPGNQVNPATRTGGPKIHAARPACDRRRTRWALRRGHSAGGDQGASGRFDDSPNRSQGTRVGRKVERRTRQPVATLETAPAYAVTPVRGQDFGVDADGHRRMSASAGVARRCRAVRRTLPRTNRSPGYGGRRLPAGSRPSPSAAPGPRSPARGPA